MSSMRRHDSTRLLPMPRNLYQRKIWNYFGY